MIYLGIDPGFNGALAAVGDVTAVHSTPCLVRDKGKGTKREYNVSHMRELLKDYKRTGVNLRCSLEAVHAMPAKFKTKGVERRQGVTSMFNMGFGFGIWQGLLAGLEIPYELITPQRWKKAMLDGTGKDKEASRLKALQLFPSLEKELRFKKDEGRAEALLLAEYLKRY